MSLSLLPFHRSGGEASDEVFSGGEVDEEGWDGSDDGRGHVHVVFFNRG